MLTSREDARQKLVAVTLELVESQGLGGVTVRAIAEAAGVNIAAISYYFGSKDALVEAALDAALAHAVGDADVILAKLDDAPAETLKELFGYLFEGALRYPEVTRARLGAGAAAAPAPRGFAEMMKRIAAALAANVGGLGKTEAARRVARAFSAVLFPSYFHHFFEELRVLGDERDRARYVTEIVEELLAPAVSPGGVEEVNAAPRKSPRPRAKRRRLG
ncbi:MAG: TetR family transcriptional regulator [Polyangiaceae bacterium]|nr:TetR family transcriptional regulator [Polyangiaceae bacterium]